MTGVGEKRSISPLLVHKTLSGVSCHHLAGAKRAQDTGKSPPFIIMGVTHQPPPGVEGQSRAVLTRHQSALGLKGFLMNYADDAPVRWWRIS